MTRRISEEQARIEGPFCIAFHDAITAHLDKVRPGWNDAKGTQIENALAALDLSRELGEKDERIEELRKKVQTQAARLAHLFWGDCREDTYTGPRGADHCAFEGTHVCWRCEYADVKAQLAAARGRVDYEAAAMRLLGDVGWKRDAKTAGKVARAIVDAALRDAAGAKCPTCGSDSPSIRRRPCTKLSECDRWHNDPPAAGAKCDEPPDTAYCCRCGMRPLPDGAQLECGCWTCSPECWDAEAGPADKPCPHRCPTTTPPPAARPVGTDVGAVAMGEKSLAELVDDYRLLRAAAIKHGNYAADKVDHIIEVASRAGSPFAVDRGRLMGAIDALRNVQVSGTTGEQAFLYTKLASTTVDRIVDAVIYASTPPADGIDVEDVRLVAGFITGWWPGLEDGITWPVEKDHPVEVAAHRLIAACDRAGEGDK